MLQSLPTFATMLLFWLLAAYVITRSPRGAIPLVASSALAAMALWLLGQGMQANASSLDEWLPWGRGLGWAGHVAAVLWYWLTLLLLREQASASARRYLRWVAYPAAALVGVAGTAFLASFYAGDWLHHWSAVAPIPPEQVTYSRFPLPPGPLYGWYASFLTLETALALLNVGLAWRLTDQAERRRPLAWLFLCALLLAAAANTLGLASWLTGGLIAAWIGHSLLAAGMVAMAWNVAAYSLLFRGQVIRRDFFYFLTAVGAVIVLYGLLFVAARVEFSFQTIALLAVTLTAVILSHALVDVSRGVWDRLFFPSDVQRLRSQLSSVVQDAALTPDIGVVLSEAQSELDEASTEHLVQLTELALRRLNNPAVLARSDLAAHLPSTLATAAGPGNANPTPLERARVLRETLAVTMDRLKPPQGEDGIESPAALQYHILREEYLQGLLNKQIMARHAISEGTFNRNRRQAIRALAVELRSSERRITDRAFPSS